ncbi:hypothetical protein [Prevotella jejuni]|uniref:hypothetical protein n=1 Tax=Prevotella jejuni TaxID=1177574 RepID=UPI00352DBADC
MSLITNKSYPHLSPTLPYLGTTPASTSYYASTYLTLFSTQPATTQAPTCHYTQPNLSRLQHLPATTPNPNYHDFSTYLSLRKSKLANIFRIPSFQYMLFKLQDHAFLCSRTCPSCL